MYTRSRDILASCIFLLMRFRYDVLIGLRFGIYYYSGKLGTTKAGFKRSIETIVFLLLTKILKFLSPRSITLYGAS
jgi:hypothetical protein